MSRFFGLVAERVGVPEASAVTATRGVLELVKDKMDPADFGGLVGRLPGAEDLLKERFAPPGNRAGGGVWGGWMKSAATAVGGDLESALGLAEVMAKAGFDPSQAGSFATQLLGFVRDHGGEDLAEEIVNALPDLKRLAGRAGGGSSNRYRTR